jgi:hypothetical protein
MSTGDNPVTGSGVTLMAAVTDPPQVLVAVLFVLGIMGIPAQCRYRYK